MNKEEKLKSIEDRIRKDLPYLMELREGCYIKQKTLRFDTYKILGKLDTRKNAFLAICIDVGRYHPLDESDLSHFKIIGHPISLNDVLIWLKLNNNLSINTIVVAFKSISIIYSNDSLMSTNLVWNLEKSLLRDQSDELINFLYETIKKTVWVNVDVKHFRKD